MQYASLALGDGRPWLTVLVLQKVLPSCFAHFLNLQLHVSVVQSFVHGVPVLGLLTFRLVDC